MIQQICVPLAKKSFSRSSISERRLLGDIISTCQSQRYCHVDPFQLLLSSLVAFRFSVIVHVSSIRTTTLLPRGGHPAQSLTSLMSITSFHFAKRIGK